MLCFTSGVTFSLRGVKISNTGDGRVLITDIKKNNENALICRSEISTFDTITSRGDWYLHPTKMSTNETDRIAPDITTHQGIIPDRGWLRSRADDSEGHRVVRLKRVSDNAEEGVFTCIITGDNSPRYLGIYYPSE